MSSHLHPAEALQNAGGDTALLGTLARLFREHAPAQLATMESAIRDRDPHRLSTELHRLKGSLAVLAIPTLEALATTVERLGETGAWTPIRAPWADLRRGVLELCAELAAFSGSSPATDRSSVRPLQ